MKDMGGTPNSGKFGWSPICSPKQTESETGDNKPTGDTLPPGADKPKGEKYRAV